MEPRCLLHDPHLATRSLYGLEQVTSIFFYSTFLSPKIRDPNLLSTNISSGSDLFKNHSLTFCSVLGTTLSIRDPEMSKIILHLLLLHALILLLSFFCPTLLSKSTTPTASPGTRAFCLPVTFTQWEHLPKVRQGRGEGGVGCKEVAPSLLRLWWLAPVTSLCLCGCASAMASAHSGFSDYIPSWLL